VPFIICPSRATQARHKVLKNKALDHHYGGFAVIIVTADRGLFTCLLEHKKSGPFGPLDNPLLHGGFSQERVSVVTPPDFRYDKLDDATGGTIPLT
jgi:hypothetical protein